MKIEPLSPPRKFFVGLNDHIEIKHCANINLDDNEQITFIINSGKEYDVVRKTWGYYGTPSVNGRLKRFNFKTALVINKKNQLFIMLVEKDKQNMFLEYINMDQQTLLCWLDEMDSLQRIKDVFMLV